MLITTEAKEIRLTKGKNDLDVYTLVSPEDYPLVSRYRWRYSAKYKPCAGYAVGFDRGILKDAEAIAEHVRVCSLFKHCFHDYENSFSFYHPGVMYYAASNIALSRFIMSLLVGRTLDSSEIVDHINHNTLDNTRDNLRLCTPRQNSFNKSKAANKSSKYLGVHLEKSSGLYVAQIRSEDKQHALGKYESELDASLVYDYFARKFFKEFANPNHPYIFLKHSQLPVMHKGNRIEDINLEVAPQ